MRRSNRSILATLMCACALVLTGCSGLPQRGAVNVVNRSDSPSAAVVLDAKGPTQGASPEELIQGFLRASSAGISDDFRVAKQFLTPEAALDWNPTASVSIFSDSDSVEFSTTPTGAIVTTVPALASIDQQGHYTAATEDSTITRQFSLMVNEDGEWRIASLDDSVVIAQTVFNSLYVRSPVYFLNAQSTAFVPDLRWFPRGRALSLMANTLLTAPSEWLAPAAHSAFTNQSNETVSVVVEDLVASIDLPVEVASLKQSDLALLEAQFKQTLIGSGLVKDVLLTAGGSLISGGEEAPTVQAYPYPTSPLYSVVSSDIHSTQDGTSTAVVLANEYTPESFSTLAIDYSSPVQWAIGLNTSHTALTRLGIIKGGETVLLEGDGLAVPSIDSKGWAWTANEGARGQVVAVNLETGDVVTVPAPELESAKVLQISVSREGSRVVLVIERNGVLHMAAYGLERAGNGTPVALGDPTWIGQGFSDIRDVAWMGELKLIVLATVSERGGEGLYTLDIGGPREPVSSIGDVQDVTAGRGLDSAVVLTSDGLVKQYSGSAWSDLASGAQAVAFPG